MTQAADLREQIMAELRQKVRAWYRKKTAAMQTELSRLRLEHEETIRLRREVAELKAGWFERYMAQALAGIANTTDSPETIARTCYRIAKAMMRAKQVEES